MPLISGTVPSLINGISQQPPTLRMPTQGEAQVNGLSHISRGLEKRPCTEHVANVGANVTSTNSNDVFIHTIRRSEDEAYALVVKGGTSSNAKVNLFDLTGFATGKAGTEVWIHNDIQSSTVTANGTLDTNVNSYLSNFTSTGTDLFEPNKLSATTIADFTFLLNKTQVVKKKTTLHGDKDYQAMVYVKVGDFGADYKVTITAYKDAKMEQLHDNFGDGGVVTVTVKTPDNKTESMTGTGHFSKSKSINNQNAVLVKNIAKCLTSGGSALGTSVFQPVKLVALTAEDSRLSGENNDQFDNQTVGPDDKPAVVVIDNNTSAGGAIYGDDDEEDKGVIDVPTMSSYFTSSETTGSGAKGLNKTDLDAVTSTITYGENTLSSTPWTVSYKDGESVFTIENGSFPFVVEVTDGKGDVYMKAINGHDEVPKFSDLPATKVKTGFVAKISGDRGSGQDDYYVEYKNSVYKETFRPKYPLDTDASARSELDNTTMPMQLYKAFGTTEYTINGEDVTSSTGKGIYFILKPVTWSARTVGDETTAPFPSFADYEEGTNNVDDALYTINDIFFHRNRLGLISDENVVLSEAAGYFNFFPNTVLSVLDTAPIDVAVSNNQVAILKSAIPFQENLLLFSDLQQFKLTSDQFLTPTSATVDVATNFETSTIAKPVPAGKTIFFPFQRGAYSGIREYMIDIASETNDANEITSHVPELLVGTVKKLAVSSNEELLCVLTDDDRSKLLVYKYFYDNQEKLQSSWSTWQFDADIVDISFLGSVAIILFRRGDSVILEKLNLSADNAEKIMDDKIGVKLDRRIKLHEDDLTTSEEDSLSEVDAHYYEDVQHDKVADTSGTKKIEIHQDSAKYGTKIKIKATDGILAKPRVGQTFKSTHEALITYTVVSSEDIEGSGSSATVEIEITPSIARDAPMVTGSVLTFTERKLVYVTETGEVIKASDVGGILRLGTDFSKSKGNTEPAVFVGIPYDFQYEFSEQFVKSGDNSINSGRLQMRNFEISYADTGFFEVEVAPKPYDSRLRNINHRTFTGRQIGATFLGQQDLAEGVFRVPVYCNSKDVKIKVKSDSWLPVAIQSADWEAFQVLRNQRI